MRAAALPTLALPLLLTYCGSKQDLLIGEIALVSEAGTGSVSGTGGAEPGVGGALAAGTAGVAGAATGGVMAGGEGGAEQAGAAGAGGDGGQTELCVDGDRPPLTSLIHRYSFDGTGTVVSDSVGGADGSIVGSTMLDGTGTFTLEGDDGHYVNLPNGLVSSLTNVTIVTWVTWTGGAGYQRIFDFGISDRGEQVGGSGRSYFAVIPLTGFEDNTARGLGAEIKAPSMADSIQIASHESMNDRYAQVALVFQSGQRIALYLNSRLLGEVATSIALSEIDDRNNWLGQSQWDRDPAFQGIFDEFRIYDVALTACQLETMVVRGADHVE